MSQQEQKVKNKMGLKVPAILVTESRTFTSIDLSQSRDDEETVDGVPTTFEAPKLSWRLVAKGFCGLPRTACMEAKPAIVLVQSHDALE